MAVTLNALLVIVAVCGLAGLWGGVHGQMGVCVSTERCNKDFQDQAKDIGHRQEEYCRLLKTKLQCLNTERTSCPPELMQYVQNQIQSAQSDQRKACGATWIQASHWLLTVAAILAVLFHHRL